MSDKTPSDRVINEQQIFDDPNEFSMYIETIAAENHQTCLEALVNYIEERDIDVEMIGNVISPTLKDKLYQNFAEAGLIKTENTLNDFLIR